MAQLVTRVRGEEHIATARLVREVPDTREPNGDSTAALCGGRPPGATRCHDNEWRRLGISTRNARQHVTGFGVLDRSVGDKTSDRAGLGSGIEPLDFIRRNLQYRRSERSPVRRRVQQREPRNAFRRLRSRDYRAIGAVSRCRQRRRGSPGTGGRDGDPLTGTAEACQRAGHARFVRQATIKQRHALGPATIDFHRAFAQHPATKGKHVEARFHTRSANGVREPVGCRQIARGSRAVLSNGVPAFDVGGDVHGAKRSSKLAFRGPFP